VTPMRRISSFTRFSLILALVGLVVGLATAAAFGAPPGGGGVTEIKRFSVAVVDAVYGYSTVAAGRASLKVTLKNDASSNTGLGSANVTIPSAFSGATIVGVASTPAGKNWGPSPTLTHLSGNVIQFRSLGSSDKLAPGQTVTATIQVTASCGSFTWSTNSAKQSNGYNGSGNDFTYYPAGAYSTTAVSGCPGVGPGYAVALRVGTLQSGSFIENVPSHLFGSPIDIVVKTVDADGNYDAPVRPGSDVEVQLAMRAEATTCNPGCTTSFGPYRVGPSSLDPGGSSPFLTLPTKLLHPGDTQLTFSGIVYPVLENAIVATASTASPQSPSPSFLTEDKSPPFDTVAILVKGNSDTKVIGTGNSSGAPCADTTVQDNTCVTFFLDQGANGSFFVEEGSCQISPSQPCSNDVNGSLIVLLPDTFQSTLDSTFNDLFKYPLGSPQCPAPPNTQPCPRYTATAPARGVIEWDKSISGNLGAPKSNLFYSLGSATTLLLAEDCTVKGIVNAGVKLCINSRNREQGSGDTVYEFLFYDDLFARRG
jgi:hypothetical protein